MKKIFDVLAVLFLLVQILLTVVICLDMPLIPTHWNLLGEVDAIGSSLTLIPLVVFNIIAFAVLTWLEYHPEKCNLPSPPKDLNAAHAEVSVMLSFVKACLMLLMACIEASIVIAGIPEVAMWVIISVLTIGVFYWINKLSKL